MVKVALLLEGWGRGGTEQYTLELAKYLDMEGYQVDLILLNDRNDADYISEVATNFNNIFQTRGIIDFVKLIRKNQYTIVHCHLYTSLLKVSLVLKALQLTADYKLVSTLHMPWRSWGAKEYFKWKLSFNFIDEIIAVADHIFLDKRLNSLLKKTQIADKCHVIYPCVTKGNISTDYKYSNDDKFTICGCGRLSKEKNWSVLIKAASILKNKGITNFQVFIIGDGQEGEYLKKLVDDLGIVNEVKFLGKRTKIEVYHHLNSSELAVLPSKFEGMPMVLLEAMSFGTPVVASKIPATEELITDNVNGSLFKQGDAVSLAGTIEWHIYNKEISSTLGDNGKTYFNTILKEKSDLKLHLDIYGFLHEQ
ncbi:glycosyltransferase [Vibrio sp. 1288]|uniref:glycosyltransferase n=1 Tax=Vibrio sp. 1288 TaxID=3074550 RepID=UPI00296687BE|nr:glycosyltransferase [Vibrio sp. 1288]MDW3137688.1 glycosyltransferase [Vibrio sp. 1288]